MKRAAEEEEEEEKEEEVRTDMLVQAFKFHSILGKQWSVSTRACG